MDNVENYRLAHMSAILGNADLINVSLCLSSPTDDVR